MPSPKFIDLMPNNPSGGPYGWVYECTNEDLPTLRSLAAVAIRGGWFVKKAKKVASISSGGEVPLTVLLPAIKGELIAVDHCLGSLAWAYFKVYLLQKFPTTAEFKKWLKSVTEIDFVAALHASVAASPSPINNVSLNSYRQTDNLNQIRNQWTATPSRLIDRARERLDLVTFIHGDLRSIEPYGPFDLLYVSNAMAHISFDGGMIAGDKIKPLLTTRGKVIATYDLTPLNGMVQRDQLMDWNNIKFAKVTCPTTRWGNITWNYNLYQKPAEVVTKNG